MAEHPNEVTLTCSDPAASIYYTLNNTTPHSSGDPNSHLYSGPIELTGNAILRAIAHNSSGDSPVSGPAYFQIDPAAIGVERYKMLLWLKADYGPTDASGALASAGKITNWIDMSGAASHGSQSTVSLQPVLSTSPFNGRPQVSFDGSAQFLQLASGFEHLNSGVIVMAVVKPTNTSSGTIVELGNGVSSNNLILSTANTTPTFTLYTGSTPHSYSAPGSLMLGRYQLLTVPHHPSTTLPIQSSIRVNSVKRIDGIAIDTGLTPRSQNSVGSNFNGTSSFFQGAIQELLVWDTNYSATTIQTATVVANAEAYLTSKYKVWFGKPPMPTFNLPAGTMEKPFTAILSSPAECKVFFTTDGTTPTTSSTPYNGPIDVSYTQTIKAIALRNTIVSDVASVTYTLDSALWPAPNSSTPTVQLQLPKP